MSDDLREVAPLIFDHECTLEGLGDDPELLAEMAGIFLEDIDGLVGQVREAVTSRDATALRASAHQLKGSASNFHAGRTTEVDLRLEMIGKQDELEGTDEVFENLVNEVERLKPELGKLAEC